MYNFEHGIENKFSFSTFSLEKKKNLSFVMAKMHLKYTVFFVCCCFDSCRYQIHALWSVTHICWGAFIYYINTCRGGVRKCQFLIILSTKNNADVGGGGGSKNPINVMT